MQEDELQLSWRRGRDGAWCAFESAVLPDPPASGIVLVWAEGGEAVYVGKGGIAKNLRWARQFEPIANRENLLVTWATLPEDRENGVWRYLVERLRPVHRERPTADRPIPVNLPWDAA
jgi:hypothetical protein